MVPPLTCSVAAHIATAAHMPPSAQTTPVVARLLAVLYREAVTDASGNLVEVRVGGEAWPDAHRVVSELLLTARSRYGVQALRWEWADEQSLGPDAMLVSSVAAVTLAPEAVGVAYRVDAQWPTQTLWAVHSERCALYEERTLGSITARPALAEYLRGLAAEYLALGASEPLGLPGVQPHAASLSDALWQPRRRGS